VSRTAPFCSPPSTDQVAGPGPAPASALRPRGALPIAVGGGPHQLPFLWTRSRYPPPGAPASCDCSRPPARVEQAWWTASSWCPRARRGRRRRSRPGSAPTTPSEASAR
jgi:hypothetical protein